MNKLQPLQDFFSAYFHEDWTLDAESPGAVTLQFFRDHHAKGDLEQVAQALRVLLETDDDDEMLAKLLFRDLGLYFDPRAIGVSTRGWLTSLADDFDSEIGRRGGR